MAVQLSPFSRPSILDEGALTLQTQQQARGLVNRDVPAQIHFIFRPDSYNIKVGGIFLQIELFSIQPIMSLESVAMRYLSTTRKQVVVRMFHVDDPYRNLGTLLVDIPLAQLRDDLRCAWGLKTGWALEQPGSLPSEEGEPGPCLVTPPLEAPDPERPERLAYPPLAPHTIDTLAAMLINLSQPLREEGDEARVRLDLRYLLVGLGFARLATYEPQGIAGLQRIEQFLGQALRGQQPAYTARMVGLVGCDLLLRVRGPLPAQVLAAAAAVSAARAQDRPAGDEDECPERAEPSESDLLSLAPLGHPLRHPWAVGATESVRRFMGLRVLAVPEVAYGPAHQGGALFLLPAPPRPQAAGSRAPAALPWYVPQGPPRGGEGCCFMARYRPRRGARGRAGERLAFDEAGRMVVEVALPPRANLGCLLVYPPAGSGVPRTMFYGDLLRSVMEAPLAPLYSQLQCRPPPPGTDPDRAGRLPAVGPGFVPSWWDGLPGPLEPPPSPLPAQRPPLAPAVPQPAPRTGQMVAPASAALLAASAGLAARSQWGWAGGGRPDEAPDDEEERLPGESGDPWHSPWRHPAGFLRRFAGVPLEGFLNKMVVCGGLPCASVTVLLPRGGALAAPGAPEPGLALGAHLEPLRLEALALEGRLALAPGHPQAGRRRCLTAPEELALDCPTPVPLAVHLLSGPAIALRMRRPGDGRLQPRAPPPECSDSDQGPEAAPILQAAPPEEAAAAAAGASRGPDEERGPGSGAMVLDLSNPALPALAPQPPPMPPAATSGGPPSSSSSFSRARRRPHGRGGRPLATACTADELAQRSRAWLGQSVRVTLWGLRHGGTCLGGAVELAVPGMAALGPTIRPGPPTVKGLRHGASLAAHLCAQGCAVPVGLPFPCPPGRAEADRPRDDLEAQARGRFLLAAPAAPDLARPTTREQAQASSREGEGEGGEGGEGADRRLLAAAPHDGQAATGPPAQWGAWPQLFPEVASCPLQGLHFFDGRSFRLAAPAIQSRPALPELVPMLDVGEELLLPQVPVPLSRPHPARLLHPALAARPLKFYAVRTRPPSCPPFPPAVMPTIPLMRTPPNAPAPHAPALIMALARPSRPGGGWVQVGPRHLDLCAPGLPGLLPDPQEDDFHAMAAQMADPFASPNWERPGILCSSRTFASLAGLFMVNVPFLAAHLPAGPNPQPAEPPLDPSVRLSPSQEARIAQEARKAAQDSARARAAFQRSFYERRLVFRLIAPPVPAAAAVGEDGGLGVGDPLAGGVPLPAPHMFVGPEGAYFRLAEAYPPGAAPNPHGAERWPGAVLAHMAARLAADRNRPAPGGPRGADDLEGPWGQPGGQPPGEQPPEEPSVESDGDPRCEAWVGRLVTVTAPCPAPTPDDPQPEGLPRPADGILQLPTARWRSWAARWGPALARGGQSAERAGPGPQGPDEDGPPVYIGTRPAVLGTDLEACDPADLFKGRPLPGRLWAPFAVQPSLLDRAAPEAAPAGEAAPQEIAIALGEPDDALAGRLRLRPVKRSLLLRPVQMPPRTFLPFQDEAALNSWGLETLCECALTQTAGALLVYYALPAQPVAHHLAGLVGVRVWRLGDLVRRFFGIHKLAGPLPGGPGAAPAPLTPVDRLPALAPAHGLAKKARTASPPAHTAGCRAPC
ncbi:hypothetical protein PAPYR_3034 [Paratrimastix pyriformis]|uniref:Uncharacterized protein n=1 Tax=Paratrimastix pyriformis TaxID=342808 RepID=A0ABQ8URS8_9EUKA|nr:hypothetical protein PAPYR_3034 [Paratrimastix pyriformis]